MSSAAASPAAEPLAEGEGEELFDLDSVGTTRSFSYDEATLLTPGRYTARSPMTSASFKKVFAENFPNLEGFPWANVCVRGGAVVDLLLARPVKDLDMFFYGLDSDEAVLKKAREVIDFLLAKERAAVSFINEQYEKYKQGNTDIKTTAAYGSHGMAVLILSRDQGRAGRRRGHGARRGNESAHAARALQVPHGQCRRGRG